MFLGIILVKYFPACARRESLRADLESKYLVIFHNYAQHPYTVVKLNIETFPRQNTRVKASSRLMLKISTTLFRDFFKPVVCASRLFPLSSFSKKVLNHS